MQISVDVHNYMETLVGAVLATDEYIEKYDNEQLADLACLALNQIRPIYIRHDVDFLASTQSDKLYKLRQQAYDAVEAAETMINDDRRKNREDDEDIPVIYKDLKEEDQELEWYESPIIPNHKK
ncbi:late competence development ComFB family protein [Vibrio sp. JC009]|uniref:late competence development ComFB family protein n=1 Tax=Vibrio sp. JC009 TaxID=2912314 RepID=UPI0023AFEAB9|nr:late competence development ComFB family protein [Vibrio sp. JC009]WED24367.1 late competence development ComFB family protein [Vibrio sp. JC009]